MRSLPHPLTSAIVGSVFALLGCTSSATQPSTPTRRPFGVFGQGLSPVPATHVIQDQERQMAKLLNEDRAAEGLPPLRYDPRLSEVARHHSGDMLKLGFFEHQSPSSGSPSDRLDAASYLFLTARENLSEALDIASSQQGLLESPHHYENIMATDVTHIGIGIVEGGVHDLRSITVTQVFATPVREVSLSETAKVGRSLLAQSRAKAGLSPCTADNRLTAAAQAALHKFPQPSKGQDSLRKLSEWLQTELQPLALVNLQVSAQLMLDHSRVVAPSLLGRADKCSSALAVVKAKDPAGRPALQVLVLIGER